MEFKETVETIRADEASVGELFGGDGHRVRGSRDPRYQERLVEAASFIAEVHEGKRPMYHLKEAMSTSDFPTLFADVLDRQLLAAYREYPNDYLSYVRTSTVPDFRSVKRFAVDGSESVLPAVGELEEYPESSLSETSDSLSVTKFGRRLDLSWEAMVNDDLDAFRRNPERLARAARRSEQRAITALYCDASGPHASLYDGTNTVASNPVLSIAALQTAMTLFSELVDDDGEPIFVEALDLVVPPALEVTALNILNAIQLQVGADGDNALQTVNWMKSKVQLHVNPYLPIIATSNGDTQWYLFASQMGDARPALEFAKLRGHEEPALYERAPDARRIGGSGDAQESFDDDSVAWRVRHVFGGARLVNTGGKKSTVASDGSGA
jgi:hypothetical protein